MAKIKNNVLRDFAAYERRLAALAESSREIIGEVIYEGAAIAAEAVTAETWKSLGTCDPKDPSKGLTTRIDLAGSEGGTEAGTHTICTPVTRTGN